MTTYNKLVRDKIPDIIAAKGETSVTHIADDAEYRQQLDKKLGEEVEEFLQSHDPDELADVLEVIHAPATLLAGMDDIEARRQRKHEARGGFTQRIILEES